MVCLAAAGMAAYWVAYWAAMRASSMVVQSAENRVVVTVF
jgi:hypothetical protein